MATDIAEAPAAGVGKLLQDNRFIVPNHQRDYSWTEHEVGQLLEDVESALKIKNPEYFLGLMVFMRASGGVLTVLDGQQRLATVVVVLSAIRDWLRQYSDYKDDANSVQERFIGNREFGEKDITAKLSLNSANNPAFEKYVISSVALEDLIVARNALKPQDRDRKLLESIVFAHMWVRKTAERLKDPAVCAKYFFELLNYIRGNASVVRLTVGSEGAAFTIFETLNDRGLDLSPLDLVKNYLFSRCDTPIRMRDLEDRWTQMMATLANVKVDKYLGAFWTSRHGRIRSTDVYDAFKRQYPDTRGAIDCSSDMVEAAEQYAALEIPDDPVWAPYSQDTRNSVKAISILGSQPTHPVMLAALKQMPVSEMDRLLSLLETLIVRYQLIGNGNPGRFETTCAVVAREIYHRRVLTARDAFVAFREIYPTDDEFKANFRIKSGLSNQKAQYVLRGLEREAFRLEKGGLAGELQPGALTVEHVMPKSSGEHWGSLLLTDPEVFSDCVQRIGNLCLLTDINRELGNKGFADKKAVYARSQLLTTKEIAAKDVWNRQAIDHRQAHLAKLAVQAWRFQ